MDKVDISVCILYSYNFSTYLSKFWVDLLKDSMEILLFCFARKEGKIVF